MAPAPIPSAVAQQAMGWLLELQSGHATPRQRNQWQAWLDQDPAHARAWQHIAEVDGQLRGVPPALALRTLAEPGMGRRRSVQLALLLTAGAGGLLAARQTGTWQQISADLRSPTGQQTGTVLPDGTRVLLNTASAVDVRFSTRERLLVLRAGELLVETAPDPSPDPATGQPRPLRVQTAQGTVHAIGTRFTVRQHEGRSDVAVLQGAVDLRPAIGYGPVQRLHAGEQGSFSTTTSTSPRPLADAATAWTDGMLVADAMRLDDFIAELARHRPGVLRCAPEVAGLRVSGSYPLADTDRVLLALTRSLPVDLHSRTRWWVTVQQRVD